MAPGGVAVSRIDALQVDGHHRRRRGRDRLLACTATNTSSTPSARDRWSSEGAILGTTAHSASAGTRTAACLWVITRAAMDHARQQNPKAYHRVVARVGQRPADRVALLADTAFGASAPRPPLAPRTERDRLGARDVSRCAYFDVQTLPSQINRATRNGGRVNDYCEAAKTPLRGGVVAGSGVVHAVARRLPLAAAGADWDRRQ